MRNSVYIITAEVKGPGTLTTGSVVELENKGPIYKISYDNLTIMQKLRSTYDGRLIYKTSYNE